MKKYFTIIYSRGPNWKGDLNWTEQSLLTHGQYMSELSKQGILILGGPFDDGTGGQSVIKVENMSLAEQILKKDPAILEGVFTATIHPWLIAFE